MITATVILTLQLVGTPEGLSERMEEVRRAHAQRVELVRQEAALMKRVERPKPTTPEPVMVAVVPVAPEKPRIELSRIGKDEGQTELPSGKFRFVRAKPSPDTTERPTTPTS
jgi:hypothetical protein